MRAEPEIQIPAERPVFKALLQVPVRRSEELPAEGDSPRAPVPFELSLLDDAEELRLQGRVDFGYLIEEENAVVGELEDPRNVLGSGERPPDTPEELHAERLSRHRGAVDGQERLSRAESLVDFPGDELFPGARFPRDEHRARALGCKRDLLAQLPHLLALADHLAVQHNRLSPEIGPAPFWRFWRIDARIVP